MKSAWVAICLTILAGAVPPLSSAETVWSLQTDVGDVNLYGISALDANHVWAVGGSLSGGPGDIYRFDGTTWFFETTMDTRHNAVGAFSPTDVWVASRN